MDSGRDLREGISIFRVVELIVSLLLAVTYSFTFLLLDHSISCHESSLRYTLVHVLPYLAHGSMHGIPLMRRESM